jgi:hypothetical protein
MPDKPKLSLTVDQQALQAVRKAILAEADGKQLRKDLRTELKDAVSPGVSDVKGKLRSLANSGTSKTQGQPLGSMLANKTKAGVRLSGRLTGVSVRIPRTPGVRGFTFAARWLNRGKWKHPVFGHKTEVEQTSPIKGYFDETLAAGKDKYRRAVLEALEKMARRIAARP